MARLADRVDLYRKDNTDKFWSYKLRDAGRTEFAFDPNTKKGLYIRIDCQPPLLPGVTDVERISGKDVSTSLSRVFSGGIHRAAFKATIDSEATLLALISHLETIGQP